MGVLHAASESLGTLPKRDRSPHVQNLCRLPEGSLSQQSQRSQAGDLQTGKRNNRALNTSIKATENALRAILKTKVKTESTDGDETEIKALQSNEPIDIAAADELERESTDLKIEILVKEELKKQKSTEQHRCSNI